MERVQIINTIGQEYVTSNIEGGEYSYVKAAGSKKKLISALGKAPEHFKLDIRFKSDEIVVLVETKQSFVESDSLQLKEYVEEEKALNPNNKIIAILANTSDDKFKIWKNEINEEHLLNEETAILKMDHYIKMFDAVILNDRETVLKNTYALNELLHKNDIDETLRSQFVGTTLLYLKKLVKDCGATTIDSVLKKRLLEYWKLMSSQQICAGIATTLDELLDGSENKQKKIELLQQNVLNHQKVKSLKKENWIEILNTILFDIYRYINADSSDGQDILNMFFIAFNKYTGKSDKNQAFTPDHITEFMCQITDVDRSKVVLDATCGSGSFLVQAMVKELADCRKGRTVDEAENLIKIVKEKHIYGIEVEEKAYGLSTTNMLIHGDGNSNIKFANCFDCEEFIRSANPDIILMNPPYNAKPKSIPDYYKKKWNKKAIDGKEDPTKGLVFIQFISDVIKRMNEEKIQNMQPKKEVKLAVLLPVSAAIGSNKMMTEVKYELLKENRLEAVFTLPEEIFYPGASVNACCMLFTMGKSHYYDDGTANETFFGYYKEDGFKKKKNLGRVEQFDKDGESKWRVIESKWIKHFRNRTVIDGFSAKAEVNHDSEWLCEAYMRTDYSKICESLFQKTVNNYLSYLVKEGKDNDSKLYHLSDQLNDIISSYSDAKKQGVQEIDYQAIEEFISKARINLQTTELKNKSMPTLDVEDWETFSITSLFSISAGRYYYADEYEEGSTPYVSASDCDNAICDKIDLQPDFDGNKITIGKIGAKAYYQPEAFCATSDVNVLTPKFYMNKYSGLFIVQIINFSENYKWSYGRQCRVGDTERIKIMLPVLKNPNGTKYYDREKTFSNNGFVPDFGWMTMFVKKLRYSERI